MGKFNCTVKVSSEEYSDIVRNGNTLRVFYTDKYVIGIRNDVQLSDGIPWAPIVLHVVGGKDKTFAKYRELLMQLMFIPPSDGMFASISNPSSMRNTFDYKDANDVKSVINEKCRKWYRLEVMAF